MKRQLYFDSHSGIQAAAIAEDGKLVEINIESRANADIIGNIYKGKVVNVIESMNAAFVNCGLERNCYLPLSGRETVTDSSRYDVRVKGKETEAIPVKKGDEIVVQIVKNPRGQKGAKVTTRLSFVGKNLIFMPENDFLGISRKITEPELKENLLFTVDQMRGKNEGFIIRTIAPYATAGRLQMEIDYLKKLYASVSGRSFSATVGDLLYSEGELPVRTLRDFFNDDVDKIYIGGRKLYDELNELLTLRVDYDKDRVVLHEGERDLFMAHGLLEQVDQLAQSTVPLANGADLVIESTEALTVIDVNSKRFLGDENLEDTVYAVNILAAREVARQVRLRDVSGIVVVDFIDMYDVRHRQAVTDELASCLSKDKVKCKVLPMNDFCLVEFTRKRTTNGVASALLQPCGHCHKTGFVLSNEYIVCRIRAELMERLAEGKRDLVIELNQGVWDFIRKNNLMEYDLLAYKGSGVILRCIPHRTFHEEKFLVYERSAWRKGKFPDDTETFKL